MGLLLLLLTRKKAIVKKAQSGKKKEVGINIIIKIMRIALKQLVNYGDRSMIKQTKHIEQSKIFFFYMISNHFVSLNARN